MSCTKVFVRRNTTFRAFFAERWSRFLRANYRNPEEVAVSYQVRYQTALNWWEGLNAPSGYAVALAYDDHPESAQQLLSERAA